MFGQITNTNETDKQIVIFRLKSHLYYVYVLSEKLSNYLLYFITLGINVHDTIHVFESLRNLFVCFSFLQFQ